MSDLEEVKKAFQEIQNKFSEYLKDAKSVGTETAGLMIVQAHDLSKKLMGVLIDVSGNKNTTVLDVQLAVWNNIPMLQKLNDVDKGAFVDMNFDKHDWFEDAKLPTQIKNKLKNQQPLTDEEKQEIIKLHPEAGAKIGDVSENAIEEALHTVCSKIGVSEADMRKVLASEKGKVKNTFSGAKNIIMKQKGSAPQNPKAQIQEKRIAQRLAIKPIKKKTKITPKAKSNTNATFVRSGGNQNG